MSRSSVVDVLLRSPEPSIRWKTRVHVLGEDPRGRGARALAEEIRTSPRVGALLSRRRLLPRPGMTGDVYRKWQGFHWVLASLADIGYPPGDADLSAIGDRVVDAWLAPKYFHEFPARTRAAAYRQDGVPLVDGRYRRCASQQGNALLSVLRLGIADERAAALVERLLHWQWPDGGWNCDRRPEADTSSFMETLSPMLALSRYGAEHRHRAATRAAGAAAEVFLGRRLFRRRSDGRVIATDFLALHYPLYWHYDVLGGLKAMAALGRIGDARCTDALDLLEEKRLADGGWRAERRYYTKVSTKTVGTYAELVDWGGTSARRMNEWVTVDALAVLVAARRLRV